MPAAGKRYSSVFVKRLARGKPKLGHPPTGPSACVEPDHPAAFISSLNLSRSCVLASPITKYRSPLWLQLRTLKESAVCTGGWPTSPVWMRKYTSDKKLWVPHFSRFLREVGLLMFIRHRLSVPEQFKISKCLGVSNGSMVAETFTSSLEVAIAGKRF